MAAPVVISVTPDRGLSMGGGFVTIVGTGFNDESSGGTVRVLFDGVESPEYGVVDDTTILAQVPPAQPGGPVDVVVENIGPGGAPVEPGTLAASFTYVRPDISTKRDLSTSSGVLLTMREALKEIRRGVLENTYWDMHPEYADADSAAIPEEKQAKAPSLKLVGPTVSEDRFYAEGANGRFKIETLPTIPGVQVGEFDAYHQPVTVRLDVQFVGVGRTKGEAMNLWTALTKFFDRSPTLVVPFDGVDPSAGSVSLEWSIIWEQRGDFSRVVEERQGFYQFAGAFVVRGVQIAAELAFQGRDVDGEVTVDPIETL